MTEQQQPGTGAQTFAQEVDKVHGPMAPQPLDESALLILACESLSRTYTYEEKNYA